MLTTTFFLLTVAVTSHPSNESELQIYRVLQRANLLAYYDTFIAQGKQACIIYCFCQPTDLHTKFNVKSRN